MLLDNLYSVRNSASCLWPVGNLQWSHNSSAQLLLSVRKLWVSSAPTVLSFTTSILLAVLSTDLEQPHVFFQHRHMFCERYLWDHRAHFTQHDFDASVTIGLAWCIISGLEVRQIYYNSWCETEASSGHYVMYWCTKSCKGLSGEGNQEWEIKNMSFILT